MVKFRVLKKSCSTYSVLVGIKTRIGGKGQFCFSVDTLLFYILHSCHKSIIKSVTFTPANQLKEKKCKTICLGKKYEELELWGYFHDGSVDQNI